MIDTKELRRLTQAVVKGWGNCDQAWLDQSEDTPAAVVGHIEEDGETYPVATIDCDQYYAAHQSLPLAKFYAAANPAAVSELLDRLEAAESDGLEQARLNGMGSEREAALIAKLEAAEKERESWKGLAQQFGNELDTVRVELETERMRLVACGVVALANTPDSAKQAREMRPEYWSASCGDVARMVDENIKLRAKVKAMEQQEPVGKFIQHPSNGIWEQDGYGDNPDARPLYTLPGAKGE